MVLLKVQKKAYGVSVVKRFKPDEDDILKTAMEDANDGEVDYTVMAKKLNRTRISIWKRIEWLKSTGGVKTLRKSFTLVEGQTLIEPLIIPLLSSLKLSEVILFGHQVAQLAKDLHTGGGSVIDRWHKSLQPWLLQHYSGTLNFRVERFLANHLAETYSDLCLAD